MVHILFRVFTDSDKARIRDLPSIRGYADNDVFSFVFRLFVQSVDVLEVRHERNLLLDSPIGVCDNGIAIVAVVSMPSLDSTDFYNRGSDG